jgi:hypothetical protein
LKLFILNILEHNKNIGDIMVSVQNCEEVKILGPRAFNCLNALPKFAQTKELNLDGKNIKVRAEVASGYFIHFNEQVKALIPLGLFCDINKNWWNSYSRSSIPDLKGKTPLQVIEYYVSK